MKIKLKLDINPEFVSNLAEQAETNENQFIQNLCTTLLKEIAVKTINLSENTKKINLSNPYSFPTN